MKFQVMLSTNVDYTTEVEVDEDMHPDPEEAAEVAIEEAYQRARQVSGQMIRLPRRGDWLDINEAWDGDTVEATRTE